VALYNSFYAKSEAGRPWVKDFIDSQDPRTQRKFFYLCSLLEEFGPKLPFPHTKYIGDGIFELRFRGTEGNIRVLYFFFEQDKVIFTNGFVKKTKRVPENEKNTALQRRKLYSEKRLTGKGVQ